MNQSVLNDIQTSIDQLPVDEQLLLISRVAEKLRHRETKAAEMDASLSEMADDAMIQAELRNIERDFALTESDGLSE